MNRRVKSLSEHLRYVALAKLDLDACASSLESSFRRFGPVQKIAFTGVQEAFEFLLPLKSFPTRYLVLARSGWCIFISDMIGESCFVDVYALSRRTHCTALAGEFAESQRSFRFIEGGEVKRSVSCYREGPSWFFDQKGDLLAFEQVDRYARRERSERLTPELVRFYLSSCSQILFPFDPRQTEFTAICGVQRSLENLRVPLEQFFVDQQG